MNSSMIFSDQGRRTANREYLLQGSILDEYVDLLLHRLRNTCDEEVIKFKNHEYTYSMREGPSMTSQTVSLRVKEPLDPPKQPWTLLYLGYPEVGDKNRPTTVRTYVEVSCTPEVRFFVQELGFSLDFDFVSQGWLFQKNRIKVSLSKVYRTMNPMNTEQLHAISKSHLIEVSLVSGSGNEQAGQEVQSFAEQLKPLVNLDKMNTV